MILIKPIFKNRWYHGKTPKLQIKILKEIVLYGQISKKKATYMLGANYSDISDAFDELLKRDFIKYSGNDTSSKNPEKFYKITESGLKALLYVDHLSPREFWKVMTLLCIVSKGQLNESQFEEHYSQFENNYLGYSVRRHFFQSWFFDDVLQQWLQDDSNSLRAASESSSSISLSQVVIECLAFHGSMTCQQLIEKTNEKEENLVKILSRYSIKPDSSFNLNLRIQSSTGSKKKKKIYNEFMSLSFIIPEETNSKVTYKLSLFGVMLAIAFIRYHYIGIDSIHSSVSNKRKDNSRKLNLFYKDVKLEEYYDRIACNYKEKIPLIFGKWSLLKSQLGSLLYDNLDFFIYKKARSNITDKSVWFGGNKEFYDDIQYIAQNAHDKIYLIYTLGRGILQQYKDQDYQYRLIPVKKKLDEIEQELVYADSVSFLEKISKSFFTNKSQHLEVSKDYMKGIEKLLKEEVTFFFYFNLNSITFSPSKDYLSLTPGQFFRDVNLRDVNQDKIQYLNEIFHLGTPKQRLMAILDKDKDIKQWFSERIIEIINYRRQISKKMSRFGDEVINPQENLKQQEEAPIRKSDKRPESKPIYEEYDIMKICSDLELVYD